MRMRLPVLLVLSVACSAEDLSYPNKPGLSPHCDAEDGELYLDTADPDFDRDCDGYGRQDDCDNTDPTRHPGVPEVNNGRDDNCQPDDEVLYGCGETGNVTAILPPFFLLAWRRRRVP